MSESKQIGPKEETEEPQIQGQGEANQGVGGEKTVVLSEISVREIFEATHQGEGSTGEDFERAAS